MTRVQALFSPRRRAAAVFRFASQPTAGPIRAEWLAPNRQSIGSDDKNNRPVIRTGIGSAGAIPSGRYTVVLTAGGRIVKRLSVRIGV